ncbi:MAG TPA: NAD(P)/FAD-dependent oxidoreductase [Gemmatimonadaceae bacterium]|nr:NAD(P)/FAD-dependent oxidoreductase [Gemmatimonadaceae bacterium]
MTVAHDDIAIIGGGAAGLATAIFARRLNPNRSVAVLDGAKKLGAKILVSGGGRCNVTNAVVTEHDFWGGRPTIVRSVLRALTVADTVRFFEEIGVTLHEERGGKLFPDSNKAREVLDALVREAERVGVSILADHRVDGVLLEHGVFTLMTARGSIAANQLVLATGGRSLPKSGSDGTGYDIARMLGHTIVATTPALAPLVLEPDEFPRELSGVSHDAELTVWVEDRASIRLHGSLLWTHFGISGPVVLNASRHWARTKLENRRVRLTLNFFPGSSFDAVDSRLVDLVASRPRASIVTLLSTVLPGAVASALTSQLGIDQDASASHLARADRRRLVHGLVAWKLPIADTRGYNYAEATAGGVELTEIDPSTMESRVCSGLYLVGEVLDVDGRIGGFNFQWAWSSAQVAARALAKSNP